MNHYNGIRKQVNYSKYPYLEMYLEMKYLKQNIAIRFFRSEIT